MTDDNNITQISSQNNSANSSDLTQLNAENNQVDDNSTEQTSNDATQVSLSNKNEPNKNKVSGYNKKTPVSATQAPLTAGALLNNRFVLEELLGSGGMGKVYRALDKRKQEAQDRNPYVAIKILGEKFARHPNAFIALQRESSKSQALAHPNIITVYDFDREGDFVYMTMEQLFGSPLDELIKKHPRGLPINQAKQIIQQIAQALIYAHSKQIIHSDLKPANIFLTKKNQVKILDFGIARAASSVDEDSSDRTVFDAGELGGLTPSYASYEMFHGVEPHASDDIFALGLIAYELLTGSHPYQRKPAIVAVAKQLKPVKIKQLKHHEWKSIANALQLKREQRHQNTDQFLKQFIGFSTTTKVLVTALVLTTVGLGSAALYRPDNILGPDTPFIELEASIQNKVTTSLTGGNEALAFNDLNGALFFFNTAYEAHPRNFDAVAGLDTIVNQVAERIDLKANSTELFQHQQYIDTMLSYSSLAEHKKLKQLKVDIAQQLAKK